LRLITLQDPNTRVVLLGATVLGIAAAVVGALAVLRKRSLVGDAVAHAALPGVCAAYFVVGQRSFVAFLVGATLFGVLAAAFVAAVRAYTRIKEDAAIAIAIGGFFGLGIVMSRIIQNQPGGNRAGLDSYIFGKAASMVQDDARTILLVAGAVLLAVALLYKELKLLCFDRDFAAGQGWPTFTLDLLLMTLVCVCTVVGLPAVGVVLMVALLVIPPVAARFWSDRLGVVIVLAGILGGASGLLGTVLSATLPAPDGALSRGWPTGPLIVLVAAAGFIFSMLLAPRRGLLADALARISLRRRVALQNLLRDAYEHLEHRADTGAGNNRDRALDQPPDLGAAWNARDITRDGSAAHPALARAMRQGLVARTSTGCVLTREGQLAAARVVRAHRLWELYLIEQADIAADHVDRDADHIEHVLPAGVIADLEQRLASEGRLPALAVAHAVPASPHPIAPAPRAPRALGVVALIGLLLLTCAPQPGALAAGISTTTSLSAPASGAGSVTRTLFHLGSYPVGADDLWTIATAVACSVACALVGSFLVLRRLSLLGDAISHAILPGLALAFIMTQSRAPMPMLAGALVVGVLTAVLSVGLHRWGRVPEDASMGVVFTTLFAIGVILVTLVSRDVDLDPGCVLYGLIEFVPFDTRLIAGLPVPRALIWLGAMLAVNLALIMLFYKELKVVCFDPHLATAMGISAALVHYGLMTAVAATSVASFEAVGSILVIAMLIAPGATAHLLTDRLGRMLALASIIAALCAILGYALAVRFNTSVAGMIATVALAVFILAAVFAPRHGILRRHILRRARLDPPPA
jgi:manganese/zinc/iron transport system permease protein